MRNITDDDLARGFANADVEVPPTWVERVAKIDAELRVRWEAEGSPDTFEDWKRADFEKQKVEAEAQRVAEERAWQRERNLRNLLEQVPPLYLNAHVDDPQIVAWAEQVAEHQAVNHLGRTSGPSLLIVGRTGVGKTFAAFGALRRIVDLGSGRYLKVTTAADMYAALRPRSGVDTEEAYARFASIGLLFIDDLGAAKSSEWTEEINYRLINHRNNHQLATLITSNVPPRELATALGVRVASRLTEMARTVALKGPDRRQTP